MSRDLNIKKQAAEWAGLGAGAAAGGEMIKNVIEKTMSTVTDGIKNTGTTGKFTKSVKNLAFSKVLKDLPREGGVLDTFEIESSGAASIISKSGAKTDLGKPVYPNQDLPTPPEGGMVEYQTEYKNPDEKSTFHPIKMEGLNVDPSGHISESNEPIELRNDTIQLKKKNQ